MYYLNDSAGLIFSKSFIGLRCFLFLPLILSFKNLEWGLRLDLLGIISAILSLGLLVLLGGFLIIAIIVILYLAATGNRWD